MEPRRWTVLAAVLCAAVALLVHPTAAQYDPQRTTAPSIELPLFGYEPTFGDFVFGAETGSGLYLANGGQNQARALYPSGLTGTLASLAAGPQTICWAAVNSTATILGAVASRWENGNITRTTSWFVVPGLSATAVQTQVGYAAPSTSDDDLTQFNHRGRCAYGLTAGATNQVVLYAQETGFRSVSLPTPFASSHSLQVTFDDATNQSFAYVLLANSTQFVEIQQLAFDPLGTDLSLYTSAAPVRVDSVGWDGRWVCASLFDAASTTSTLWCKTLGQPEVLLDIPGVLGTTIVMVGAGWGGASNPQPLVAAVLADNTTSIGFFNPSTLDNSTWLLLAADAQFDASIVALNSTFSMISLVYIEGTFSRGYTAVGLAGQFTSSSFSQVYTDNTAGPLLARSMPWISSYLQGKGSAEGFNSLSFTIVPGGEIVDQSGDPSEFIAIVAGQPQLWVVRPSGATLGVTAVLWVTENDLTGAFTLRSVTDNSTLLPLSFILPIAPLPGPPVNGSTPPEPVGPPRIPIIGDLAWLVPALLVLAILFFVTAIVVSFVWCFKKHPKICGDFHMCKALFGVCSGFLFFLLSMTTIIVTTLMLSQPDIFLNTPVAQIFADYSFFWQYGVGALAGMILFFTCMMTCFQACCFRNTCPNPKKSSGRRTGPSAGANNHQPAERLNAATPRNQIASNPSPAQPGQPERKLADDEVVFMPIVALEGNTNGDPEILKLGKKIGEGSFGVVYLSQRRGLAMAIKMLKDLSKETLNEYIGELKMLCQLQSPNILRLFGAAVSESKVGMVTEFCDRGSLDDVLKTNNLSVEQIKRISLEIVVGVNAMHSQDTPILHRDLKPANIFVNKDLKPKIGDFGLAKAHMNQMTSGKGTLLYMAPESFIEGDKTPMVDIYAVGLIIFEMMMGARPFANYNDASRLLREILNGSARLTFSDPVYYPNAKRVPSALQQIILQCVDTDPVNRPRSSKLYEMLKGCDWE